MSAAFWTRLDALEQAEARNVDARASTAMQIDLLAEALQKAIEGVVKMEEPVNSLIQHLGLLAGRVAALEAEAERRKGGRPRKVEEAA